MLKVEESEIKSGWDDFNERVAAQRRRVAGLDAETQLRELWTAQGVPVERQNEIIREIDAKAAPGTRVGPFVI